MIIGQPGAGKTTFSLTLGKLLDLPTWHLDRMMWQADGSLLPLADRNARIAAVLANPGYVLEGGYAFSYAARLAGCDTLIWLDMGLWRRFLRVLRRRMSGEPGQVLQAPREARRGAWPFWRMFWLEHPLQWVRLSRLVGRARAQGRVQVIHLRGPTAVQRFLDGLQK